MRYQHTQRGWISLIVLAAGLGMLAPLLFAEEATPVLRAMLIVGSVLMLALACLFRSLTVTVDDESIRAAFGSGWPRLRVPLQEVTAVVTTRPHWLYGLGIRLTGDGWLWRLTTGDAIKLERGDKPALSIGTNDAPGLRAAIEARRQ